MILKRLYQECKKIKTVNDELVLSFTDARQIKAALEKFILSPEAWKPKKAVIKKKIIKRTIDDPFENVEIEPAPEFDKWIEEQPRGYDSKIDTAPLQHLRNKKLKKRKRPGGFKQIGKKDKMVTAKSDMINHIQDLIDRGEITPLEYLAEPNIYLDSQIVGNYINNPIIQKSIIKHFKRKYEL